MSYLNDTERLPVTHVNGTKGGGGGSMGLTKLSQVRHITAKYQLQLGHAVA
jgi:hypothetical protein